MYDVLNDELILLLARGRDRLETFINKLLHHVSRFSYSLGDAIDWKLLFRSFDFSHFSFLLLARGRDRLETKLKGVNIPIESYSPTR